MTIHGRRALAPLLVLWLAASAARAIETDQYYAWGRPLADSTEMLNAKINLEISRLLAEVDAQGQGAEATCADVRSRLIGHFRLFIFHDLELWANNSSLVARIPATPEEELEYRERYLHREHGAFEFVTWMPPSPTIVLNGVRLGTDKLTHFTSQGSWYYRWYRNAREHGETVEEAERRAIDRGLLTERTILGKTSSGVLSVADLEANYQGMVFLRSLCEDDPPQLERTEAGWRLRKPFDFRDWVTPEWDESYEPARYSKRRWKHVKPALERYCEELALPEVREQRADYAARDRETPTEKRVAELVAAGKIHDPAEHSIERVCNPPASTTSVAAAAE